MTNYSDNTSDVALLGFSVASFHRNRKVCVGAKYLCASHISHISISKAAFFIRLRHLFFYSVSDFLASGLPLFLYAHIAQYADMAMQYQKNIKNQNADFFLPRTAVNRAHAKSGRAKFIAARAHPNVCAILIVDVSPPTPRTPNSIADANATMPMVTNPRSILLDR